MTRIIERLNDENYGNGSGSSSEIDRVVERNMPDKYSPSTIIEGSENVVLLQISGEPTSGKIYTMKFNTSRNIIMETPKTITVLGWGVEIRKIYKPEPNLLYVDIIPLRP